MGNDTVTQARKDSEPTTMPAQNRRKNPSSFSSSSPSSPPSLDNDHSGGERQGHHHQEQGCQQGPQRQVVVTQNSDISSRTAFTPTTTKTGLVATHRSAHAPDNSTRLTNVPGPRAESSDSSTKERPDNEKGTRATAAALLVEGHPPNSIHVLATSHAKPATLAGKRMEESVVVLAGTSQYAAMPTTGVDAARFASRGANEAAINRKIGASQILAGATMSAAAETAKGENCEDNVVSAKVLAGSGVRAIVKVMEETTETSVQDFDDGSHDGWDEENHDDKEEVCSFYQVYQPVQRGQSSIQNYIQLTNPSLVTYAGSPIAGDSEGEAADITLRGDGAE